jgi:1,4-dihydroxy-2-naphthoate octaprenyltransferase
VGYRAASIGTSLTKTVRAGEWWEYKLAPMFAAFYATAVMLRVPVSALWLEGLTTLLAVAACAAWVSVINDLTDREEDLAAGKPNRLAGKPRGYAAALIALTAGAGAAFCILWRHDTLLLAVYLSSWLAFSLYSLPPFRFKRRGILGVLCDASGANLFPTLVAVILAFRGAERPVVPIWLIAVGTWAFMNGIRGILWHQLTDIEYDRIAGVRTFAQGYPKAAARVGTLVAFPLELAGLAAMLWMINDPLPVWVLGAYSMLVLLRRYRWRMAAVIVKPKPRFQILLYEYYDAWLPISILVASALRYPLDFIVLAIHLLLFPSRARQTLKDLGQLWRERYFPFTWKR